MSALVRIAHRIDAVCAQLNPGLSTVALALALLTATAWLVKHPQGFQLEYDDAASAVGVIPEGAAADPR
jgi:hypothetical protein